MISFISQFLQFIYFIIYSFFSFPVHGAPNTIVFYPESYFEVKKLKILQA